MRIANACLAKITHILRNMSFYYNNKIKLLFILLSIKIMTNIYCIIDTIEISKLSKLMRSERFDVRSKNRSSTTSSSGWQDHSNVCQGYQRI